MKKNAIVMALCLIAIGCTSTSRSRTEAGLFGNNPEALLSAYEHIEKKILSGEAITIDDLKEAGFDLDASNIKSIPGITALKIIFGEAVFKDSVGDFSEYRGYLIRYRDIKVVTDRIYISHKETTLKGMQAKILILLKDDVLCYSELESEKLDIYYSEYELFKGILNAIKSPGKAAVEILIAFEEYQNPGLDLVFPIGIR